MKKYLEFTLYFAPPPHKKKKNRKQKQTNKQTEQGLLNIQHKRTDIFAPKCDNLNVWRRFHNLFSCVSMLLLVHLCLNVIFMLNTSVILLVAGNNFALL